MTQEELKAILEEFKAGLPKGINEADVAKAVEAKMAEMTAKIENFATSADFESLKNAMKALETEIAKSRVEDEEKVDSIEKALLKKWKELGITTVSELKNHPSMREGIEIKAEVPTLTTGQTGTIGRTQMDSMPYFPPLRQLAFIPYMRKRTLPTGKSLIGWNPAAYTSYVGYLAENNANATNDAATATEKTRQMAKISAIKIVTNEVEEDLPEFAAAMAERMREEALVYVDGQIYAGDGNPDTNANPTHIYGLANHATTFDATEFAATIEKANLSDLIDSIKTKAKTLNHTIDRVWMNPVDAFKYRRTKDADGNYVIGTLITGESVVSGVSVVETNAVTAGTLLAGNSAVMQLISKREMIFKIGEFGDDAKYDRKSALLFARMQVLVEDEDRKAVYKVADIAADLAEIDTAQA
jgi:hypothetical protein